MATYHHTIEATGAPAITADGLNKPAGSTTPSTPDLRRLAGGPVRAESAAEAAERLARRLYGKQGRVESLVYVARTWRPNGFGGGAVVGKAWQAVLILAPTAEQQYYGNIDGRQHYRRAAISVLLVEGSVRDLRTGDLTTATPEDPVHVQTCVSVPAGPCRLNH